MIKINKYYVTEEYEHTCSACGRKLAGDHYESLYTIDLDKVTIKLCRTCFRTLSRKLNNYKAL